MAGADVATQAKADLDDVVARGDQALARLKAQREEIVEQLSQPTALTPEAAAAREVVADLEDQRSRLITQRDGEVTNAVGAFERQRDSFVKRIDAARRDGDRESARRLEEELRRLANPRQPIIAKFEGQLSQVEAALGEARQNFNTLRQQGPAMAQAERERLLDRRNEIDEEIALASADWRERESAVRERWTDSRAEAANADREHVRRQQRFDNIQTELAEIDKKRIPLARTDQVRRIAGQWYGVRPEEVSAAQAGTVSVFWFGSLALIAVLPVARSRHRQVGWP